jgi:hypothetical protein
VEQVSLASASVSVSALEDRLESEDGLLVLEGKGPDGDDDTKLIGLEVFGDMSIAVGG